MRLKGSEKRLSLHGTADIPAILHLHGAGEIMVTVTQLKEHHHLAADSQTLSTTLHTLPDVPGLDLASSASR